MYPGVAVLNSGVVPVPVLNRKCLQDRRKSSLRYKYTVIGETETVRHELTSRSVSLWL